MYRASVLDIFLKFYFSSQFLFHRLYRSPNIVRVIKSRRLEWAEHVARMEEGAIKILTCNSTVKRPLGRPKRKY